MTSLKHKSEQQNPCLTTDLSQPLHHFGQLHNSGMWWNAAAVSSLLRADRRNEKSYIMKTFQITPPLFHPKFIQAKRYFNNLKLGVPLRASDRVDFLQEACYSTVEINVVTSCFTDVMSTFNPCFTYAISTFNVVNVVMFSFISLRTAFTCARISRSDTKVGITPIVKTKASFPIADMNRLPKFFMLLFPFDEETLFLQSPMKATCLPSFHNIQAGNSPLQAVPHLVSPQIEGC